MSDDELRAKLDELTESVRITDGHVRTLVRLHADSRADIDRIYEEMKQSNERWAEAREDIKRLYAAWPDHLRNHPQTPDQER